MSIAIQRVFRPIRPSSISEARRKPIYIRPTQSVTTGLDRLDPLGLIAQGDAGYRVEIRLLLRYAERLAQARLEASVGNVGDSYDNALAETVIGLRKTELIEREAPWRNLGHAEYRTFH